MPIVSPWVFYLIDTISNLFAALMLVVIVSAGTAAVAWLISLIGEEETIIKKWTKRIYPPLIVCIISLIIMVFIPSQETMYKMLVANFVTYENVETATDVIKDSVDYIFEKLDEEEEEQ